MEPGDPGQAPETVEKEAGAPRGYEKRSRYISAADGGTFTEKPEHMTQLRGKYLVPKTHPVIRFRGKLDTLQADILVLIEKYRATSGWPANITRNLSAGPSQGLAADLTQILDRTREILRAEVLDEQMDDTATLLGLTDAQQRKHSHTPKKYYGIGHFRYRSQRTF